MKFILEHDAQGRTTPGLPLVVEVTPERRTEYPLACKCQWVFKLHPSARPELIERRLLLEQQADKDYAICFCLGRLAPESVVELLEGGARPEPVYPKLTRALAVIDLETTDADATTCAIFQFGVTVMEPDGTRRRWEQTFKPWKPISPGAAEKTGTTNAMVENCPPFSAFAAKIAASLKGKDLAGFNIKHFDAVVLDQEFRRNQLKLDLDGVTIIDAFHIYQRKDPRDLSAAVRKYCNREHDGAHGAAADSDATADVLCGQLGMYPDLAAMSLAELDTFSLRDPDQKLADIAGKMYFDKDGDLRYTMAKVRDVKVKDDPGFAYWMRKQNNPPFPESTIECLEAELRKHGLL